MECFCSLSLDQFLCNSFMIFYRFLNAFLTLFSGLLLLVLFGFFFNFPCYLSSLSSALKGQGTFQVDIMVIGWLSLGKNSNIAKSKYYIWNKTSKTLSIWNSNMVPVLIYCITSSNRKGQKGLHFFRKLSQEKGPPFFCPQTSSFICLRW